MNYGDFFSLVKVFKGHGVSNIVISPGSRNAPLIDAFVNCGLFTCHSIIDERSAGFFALGIAQQTEQPVVLLCTSGSALMNYGPAVVEAFYQHVPLFVCSADRPKRLIDQGHGQTIRQLNVFESHTVWSGELDLNDPAKSVNDSLNRCVVEGGPAHLNVPLDEPLYGALPRHDIEYKIGKVVEQADGIELTEEAIRTWENAEKVLLVIGQLPRRDADRTSLVHFQSKNPGIVVLTESVSNVSSGKTIQCIDRTIEGMSDAYRPDLIVRIGGAIVSKKIKALLEKWKVTNWHFHLRQKENTFGNLEFAAKADLSSALDVLGSLNAKQGSSFAELWAERSSQVKEVHKRYLATQEFCDLIVHETILAGVPGHYVIHFANSTAVRYSQLFDSWQGIENYSNRGTSGIDGCTSTAIGASIGSQKPTVLITGDIAFMYDLSALMIQDIPSTFRIVVVNNGGGNIFRVIPGPETVPQFERFMEAEHNKSMKEYVTAFGLEYRFADSMEGLNEAWKKFFEPSDVPVVLEIKTEAKTNAQVLREYFKSLHHE